MNKAIIILMLLFVLLVAVTGCMRDPGVCNYDGVCQDDETNNCQDCHNVLGRDIAVPTNTNSPANSP